MERSFGMDLGHVRIHTDALAARSAVAVDADAYTVGRHIVFAAGRYAVASPRGRHLLAHELTRIAQQRHSSPDLDRLVVDSAREPETERVGAAFGTHLVSDGLQL